MFVVQRSCVCSVLLLFVLYRLQMLCNLCWVVVVGGHVCRSCIMWGRDMPLGGHQCGVGVGDLCDFLFLWMLFCL